MWLEQLGTCFASMLKPGQHGSSPNLKDSNSKLIERSLSNCAYSKKVSLDFVSWLVDTLRIMGWC